MPETGPENHDEYQLDYICHAGAIKPPPISRQYLDTGPVDRAGVEVVWTPKLTSEIDCDNYGMRRAYHGKRQVDCDTANESVPSSKDVISTPNTLAQIAKRIRRNVSGGHRKSRWSD